LTPYKRYLGLKRSLLYLLHTAARTFDTMQVEEFQTAGLNEEEIKQEEAFMDSIHALARQWCTDMNSNNHEAET